MSEDRITRSRASDMDRMSAAITEFLEAAGFDTASEEHLLLSGRRVAEAWARDLLEGHAQSPVEALGEPFPEKSSDMVLIGDIEFFSSCPHHLMPYQGRAHIAYVPKGLAVGFSGVVRLLDAVAHRLTLQEWLTRDVVATLMEVLQPAGAACIIEATPMCVFARGVRRPCRIVSTSFQGTFEQDAALREELVSACLKRS
ncbi:MAG: GTP cyclohydrolase I [Myxococcota bacterium]|nr:GTP cyclohydrolase I [Myxococcota bacterium]